MFKKMFMVVLIMLFCTNAYAMSEATFYRKIAECIVPYFAAGLKWKMSKKEKARVIREFAKKLPRITTMDASMTIETVNNICRGYKNLRTPQEMSEREFVSILRQNGVGNILDAMLEIKK